MDIYEYTEKLTKLNAIRDSAAQHCAWAVVDNRPNDARKHAKTMREAQEAAMAMINEANA